MNLENLTASSGDTTAYDKHYQELVSRYGKELMEQSEQYIRQLDRTELEEIFEELFKIYAVLGSMKKACEPAYSEVVQEMVHKHYSFFKKFGDFYNIPAYRQLAESYVKDAHYHEFFEDFAPHMGPWLQEAINIYCDTWEMKLDPEERVTPQKRE